MEPSSTTRIQGLHPDKPVTFSMRSLPRWRQEGATYFVTFRLGDSLPAAKLHELAGIRDEWERTHPPPHATAALESLAKTISEHVERWLDQGSGRCLLKHAELAAHVTQAMHHFDGSRYELGAYVVMPNHVHAIVRPLLCRTHPLEGLLGSWKQFSARHIHAAIKERGSLWQESFDRIIRDEEHLYRVIQYIARNPKNAGLSVDDVPRWIRPEWVRLGWRFEDETRG